MKKIIGSIASVALAAICCIIAPVKADAAMSITEIKDSAKKISFNEEAIGNLDVYTEQDWYSFEVTEEGYCELFAGPKVDDDIRDGWTVSVYFENDLQNSVYSITNVKSDVSSLAISFGKGTYYVCVKSSYLGDGLFAPSSASKYYVKPVFHNCNTWEHEKNDSNADANIIDVNTIYCGNMHSGRDEDYYKFTTNEDGVFSISFGPDEETDLENIRSGWKLTLYNDKLEQISSVDEITSAHTSFEYPYGAGTFYLKIQASNPSWSDIWGYSAPWGAVYDLCVNYKALSDWETEANNVSSLADSISINKGVNGNLQSKEDVDWYKVNVNKDGYSQIKFDVDPNSNLEKIHDGWKVSVYDSNMTEIATYSNITSSIKGQFFAFKKGTHFIKVEAVNKSKDGFPAGINYNLTYLFKESSLWEKEWNNESNKATSVTPNKTYNGVLTTNRDVDYYKVKLSKNGAVDISFSKGAGASMESINHGWSVYLYKGSEVIEKIEGVKSKDSMKLDLKAGTYLIKVVPAGYYQAPTQCLYKFSVKYTNAPKATSITKAVPANKKVTLTWKKSDDATGYYVYRSTQKDGEYKKIATIKKKTTVNYVDKKGLKAKKTYYYKIVPYKTANGVTATTESKVKSAKTK